MAGQTGYLSCAAGDADPVLCAGGFDRAGGEGEAADFLSISRTGKRQKYGGIPEQAGAGEGNADKENAGLSECRIKRMPD